MLFIQSSFSISSSNDQSFFNSPSKRIEPKDDVDDDNLVVVVSKSSPSGLVENFRQAAGIHNIYRCASTDLLADCLHHGCDDDLTRIQWQQPSDRFVFEKAGCILDLRSPNERDEFKARKWTAIAGIKVLDIDDDDNSFSPYNLFGKHQRVVTRINVLSPARFKSYIEQHWLSPTDTTRNTFGKERELHVLRMKALNDRGLFGLNQIILETGKDHLCKALQLITMYLERYPKNNIVIHCVQGKDRTGMLVMLLQSILGYSDELIIQDYVLSNQMLGGSAVADTGMKQTSNNMNPNLFSGANQSTMRQTLTYLRTTYGSIVPDYTNSIGFDEHWRKRLLAVLIPTNHKAGTRSRL